MSSIFDCQSSSQLLAGMRQARAAVSRGELVVLRTDTVYGVGADAFNPRAVQRLLDAKGRTRQSPPPVLIPDMATLDALAEHVPVAVRALAEKFWPGALTIVLHARRSLQWDLGDTRGTVALRMPDDELTLELLVETGPLAVSSANAHGQPAARSAQEAYEQLGDAVAVYLDGGEAPAAANEALRPGSTIIDGTALDDANAPLVILRKGVIPEHELQAVIDQARQDASHVSATDANGIAASSGDDVQHTDAPATDLSTGSADAGGDAAG